MGVMAATGVWRSPSVLPLPHPSPEALRRSLAQSSSSVPCIPQLNNQTSFHQPRDSVPSITNHSLFNLSSRKHRRLFCRASLVVTAEKAADVIHLDQITQTVPQPVLKSVRAFGPATVANLGPGFDYLGCALNGLGDYVTAEVRDDVADGTIIIESITGDGGRLSLEAGNNCAGIAANATLELLGVKDIGLSLTLEKGLPLGSGLGSSAASAAAAAWAVNAVFGGVLTRAQLVEAGLVSEATVSGYHADNIAPAIMGGFVLVRSYSPLQLIPLQYPQGRSLYFVVVTPAFEAPTREMRAVLPQEVTLKKHIANCSQGAALVSAILTGDANLLGSALASDTIVEPRRGPLIPGLAAVKVNAMAAGAYGCTISGAGPTAVAITDSEEKGKKIGEAMQAAFAEVGRLKSTAAVLSLNREGAQVVE